MEGSPHPLGVVSPRRKHPPSKLATPPRSTPTHPSMVQDGTGHTPQTGVPVKCLPSMLSSPCPQPSPGEDVRRDRSLQSDLSTLCPRSAQGHMPHPWGDAAACPQPQGQLLGVATPIRTRLKNRFAL